jgi:hypothetical protein
MIANRTDKTREIKKAIKVFCDEAGIAVEEFINYLQEELSLWETLATSGDTPSGLRMPYLKDCLYAYNIVFIFQ